MEASDHSEFTVLENKTIGRNLATFRMLRDKKALEVAEFLGVKEATYTKYERGESKITIEMVQKIADFLKVDPIQILTSQPGYVIENIKKSPFSVHGNVETHFGDKQQTEVMMKMMETMMQMNEAIKKILEGR
ncbi:helix-turn-helix domain-containing protein [Marinoscillum sp.]|uniref:helix-turn-helix domain-containing protein n=1 Tax=Marinoscillum sp. TaxID=2024838 RepID=UPI003BADA526